jgi:cbb3-type cytochrome c oxidase subunit III
MKRITRRIFSVRAIILSVLFCIALAAVVAAGFLFNQETASAANVAKELKNPFAGNAAAIKAGEQIFDSKCADCHMGDATGGAGPDLTDDVWIYGGTDTDVFTTISGGRKGGMPSWRSELKEDEIWKVISYIRSLAKKK